MIKKTKEHHEAEKFARNRWRRNLDGQKRVDQAKAKVQSQKNHARDAEGEQTSWLSSTLLSKKEGETIFDSQKWKEVLERYSKNMYQDEEMRMKARKDVDEWEEADDKEMELEKVRNRDRLRQ